MFNFQSIYAQVVDSGAIDQKLGGQEHEEGWGWGFRHREEFVLLYLLFNRPSASQNCL